MTKKERITQNIQKKVVWETKIEGKHKSCLFLHKTINYEQRMEKPFAAATLRKRCCIFKRLACFCPTPQKEVG